MKSKLTAILLCFFLGSLGIHRFYLGYTLIGVIQLLTFGGLLIWVIDLGPEGGDRGGRIVYQGIPKNCISKPESSTGKFLEQSFNITIESRVLMSNCNQQIKHGGSQLQIIMQGHYLQNPSMSL